MQTYAIEIYQAATYRFEIKAEDEKAAQNAAYEFWGELSSAEEAKYLDDVHDSIVDKVIAKDDK
ncbi:hypothetical protein [Streptomyces sp. NPDC059928]|uniref:hypothetical protein n=1 Tax=unclassified Streptomyces TaxID=2593676 RepID=UPI00364B9DDF